jgi:alpha-amylase/alpha-mannosidase (GH57 family)
LGVLRGRRHAVLNALYQALADAPDIRTRTPSDLLAEGRSFDRLDTLASGSWIDADFHIWIGHAEKNRAWDLLARARQALVASGATVDGAAESWRALHRAEGSDWFWWFGDDHHTDDRDIFDRLFREQLRAVYECADSPRRQSSACRSRVRRWPPDREAGRSVSCTR